MRIARDGKQLYYAPTIDTNDNMSSFKKPSGGKEDTIINKLNKAYDIARKHGFKYIYLSIIPNPVSILTPGYNGLHYNNMVSRIQSNPKLEIPFIDLTPEFKLLKNKVYLASDSHWNRRGAYIWLDKFNAELAKIQAQNSNGN